MIIKPRSLIKPQPINPGTQTRMEHERIEDVQFNIHKFNNRARPNPKNTLIISCFSEFGCETLGVLYSISRIAQNFPGYYIIVMGWYGREYFYRHLADEFWELKEEHQWLREYCRAFHHDSRNLKKVEEKVKVYGHVLQSAMLGQYTVGNVCKKCRSVWAEADKAECPACQSKDVMRSLFDNVQESKKMVVRLPAPSREKLEKADSYLKSNSVGIFARGRKCYGRNLQPEFYVKLIGLLKEMGYSPVWLGEKQTTQPCPVEGVIDFSRMEEAKDLELTLAIVSRLSFTVQFWTASTRLAGMLGVPYLLFESPDQIYGNGQEGYRRNLCDFGPRKLCLSHFKSVHEDNDTAINLVKKCIEEMQHGDYAEVLGMLESDMAVQSMINDNSIRIGANNER